MWATGDEFDKYGDDEDDSDGDDGDGDRPPASFSSPPSTAQLHDTARQLIFEAGEYGPEGRRRIADILEQGYRVLRELAPPTDVGGRLLLLAERLRRQQGGRTT